MTTSARLTFLGTADSQGVPRFWCDCSVCEEARTTGANARKRPCALLRGDGELVLIDAAPELRLQLVAAGTRRIDAVVITHAHNDHVAGLPDLGDLTRWTGATCPVYAASEAASQVSSRYGYLFSPTSDYRQRFPLLPLEGPTRRFAGYDVTALRVPHGYNGFSYALKFERPGARWAYMPDCLGLKDLEPWRALDLLVLGTSHYREDAPIGTRSVYDVEEASELVACLAPKHTVLTHLGHGIDRRKAPPEGMVYAQDGLEIELP